jgi:RNA methyltransferase, TrmH family
MRRISSRQNPLVARFRDLARGRGTPDCILLEGEHLVEEALDSGLQLDTVAFAERLIDARRDGLVDRAARAGAELVRVPDAVMAALSPVRQPSGVVAIARATPAALDAVLAAPAQLVLLLAGIQDAGNVGAIVRAADAAGASGIVTTDGTADPFGWKALRGAMGSTFRVPIAVRQPLRAVLDAAGSRGLPIAAAVPRGGVRLQDANLRRPVAVLLGGEGGGLADELVAAADQRISIPMRPPVESLNVAVTAALILYEASRQRDDVAIPR